MGSAGMNYLVCQSAEHAELIDGLIFARLQDVDNAHGSGWSGVYTDGTRFGVLWAFPASDLFGELEIDGLEIVESDDWTPVPPPSPPHED